MKKIEVIRDWDDESSKPESGISSSPWQPRISASSVRPQSSKRPSDIFRGGIEDSAFKAPVPSRKIPTW